MADLAFGIIGVVSLAIQVGQALDKVRRNFKDLPDDLKHFHSELRRHRATLESTQAILRRSLKNGPSGSVATPLSPRDTLAPAGQESASPAGHNDATPNQPDDDWMPQCHAELTRVLNEITVPKTSLRRRWDRVKKTLRSDALQASMSRLHRYCDQVNQNVNVQSLEAALQMQEELHSLSDAQLKDQHRSVLNWLSTFHHTRRQQDLLSKWHEGTVDWVFEQTEFIEWCEGFKDDMTPKNEGSSTDTPLSSRVSVEGYRSDLSLSGTTRVNSLASSCWIQTPSAPIIWYHGGPGVGKSVMTSRVIHDLQEQRAPDVAILYLYCDYKDRSNQDILSLLSSLVRQATEQAIELQKDLPDEVRCIYQRYGEGQSGSITLSEAENLLESLIGHFRRVFILIDGLDEFVNGLDAGYQAQKPVEVLTRIYAVFKRCRSNLRLFLTSREHTTLIHSDIPALKVPVEARESDLRSFVESRIRNDRFYLSEEVKNRAGLQGQIVKKIVDKASGQFLLASLTVHGLGDEDNIRDLKDALEHLPVDHIERYKEAIERIDSHKKKSKKGATGDPLGIQVMGFILHAHGSLSVEQMQHALAIRPGDEEFQRDGIYKPEPIVSSCAGIVRLNVDDRFEFVHNSVVEFLQTHELCAERFAKLEESLVQRCIAYMSLKDFAMPVKDMALRSHQFPFLPYAVDNFGSHASSCIRSNRDLLPGYIKFMRQDIQLGALQFYAAKLLQKPLPHRIQGWRSSLSDLQISIVFGLVEATRYMLDEEGINIEQVGFKIETALHMAARAGNIEAVRLLLDEGADVARTNYSFKNALDIVLHEPLLRLFLRLNKDWSGQELLKRLAGDIADEIKLDKTLRSAVIISRFNLDITDGKEEVAHLLIDAGANLNAELSEIATPLQLAVIYSREKLVQHLLEMRANPWVDHELGLLPLELCLLVEREPYPTARLLHGKMTEILKSENMETNMELKAKIQGPVHAQQICRNMHMTGGAPQGHEDINSMPRYRSVESLEALITDCFNGFSASDRTATSPEAQSISHSYLAKKEKQIIALSSLRRRDDETHVKSVTKGVPCQPNATVGSDVSAPVLL